MIWVDVHLIGYLAKYSPTKKETFRLELESEATISQLLVKIQIPPELEKVVLVNGCHRDGSAQLTEGDEVSIFIPEAGG